MKPCNKCGMEKAEQEFYPRSNKCKECAKADARAHRAARLEYYREYDRQRSNQPIRVKSRAEYANTARGQAAAAKAKKLYIERNEFKRAAHNVLANALRDGKIENPGVCLHCGSTTNVQGHHTHYDEPLAVYWLCAKCHAQTHKEHRERTRNQAA